jgi:hypothetical protein
VILLEVDDVSACEVRGSRVSSREFAASFPRDEDRDAIDAWDRGALAFLIVDRGVVVGTCGTHGPPDADGSVEFGWGLVEDARGRGIGSCAVAQMLAEVRRRHPVARLVAHTEWRAAGEVVVADSPASESILVRLGFTGDPPPTVPAQRAWRLPAGPVTATSPGTSPRTA